MTHEKEESRLISCSCKSAQKVTRVTCSTHNITRESLKIKSFINAAR